MRNAKRILKSMLEEKYVGKRVRLFEMKGEPQMKRGLVGKVEFVDDECQLHTSWGNGSSLALNIEEDSFEILPEDQEPKIFVPVFGGEIIAERNADPMYDGICVYLKDNSGFTTDIVIIEADPEEEKKQINVYNYEDVYDEDWTRKSSIRVEKVLMLNIENEGKALNKWAHKCLYDDASAIEVLSCKEAREELTKEEFETILDITGDSKFVYVTEEKEIKEK